MNEVVHDTRDIINNVAEIIQCLPEEIKKPCTVTLAMCTHNPNRQWLQEALDSIRGLYNEVIIVDDSDIPVPEATIHFQKKIGLPDARNVAVNAATSEYIAFLDDDDIIVRESVAALRETIQTHHPDVCYFPLQDMREDGSYIAEGWGYTGVSLSKIVEENQIPYASWFKKTLWEKIGGYQYEIEDWDFWVRAVLSGAKFIGIPVVGLKHRRRESNSRTWRFLVNNATKIKTDIINRANKFIEGMYHQMPSIPSAADMGETQQLENPKVCFVVTATGKYISFINPLIESMKKWCRDFDFKVLVFTDSNETGCYEKIHTSFEPWPFSTLRRFFYYLSSFEKFSEFDYVFAIDADVLFVGSVGKEILGKTVAVLHPVFYNSHPDEFTYERRKMSSAYIGQGKKYYAGAFYGGEKSHFIEMLKNLVSLTEVDLKRGMVAVWHDESYLNRYFFDNPPEKTLEPSHCYSDKYPLPQFEKKILLLEKNREEMRQLPD
jgi:histo-blood group ABO system transferase